MGLGSCWGYGWDGGWVGKRGEEKGWVGMRGVMIINLRSQKRGARTCKWVHIHRTKIMIRCGDGGGRTR